MYFRHKGIKIKVQNKFPSFCSHCYHLNWLGYAIIALTSPFSSLRIWASGILLCFGVHPRPCLASSCPFTFDSPSLWRFCIFLWLLGPWLYSISLVCLFVCVYVFVCAHTCVWGMCAHVEARGRHLVVFLSCSPWSFWRQRVSQWNWNALINYSDWAAGP